MIQNLIQTLIPALYASFAFPSEGKVRQIRQGPATVRTSDPLPSIILEPGQLHLEAARPLATVEPEAGQKSLFYEFRQQLLIDIYGASMADTEKWTGLVVAAILLDAETLLATCKKNFTPRAAGDYTTQPAFDEIRLVCGEPHPESSPVKMRTEFKVCGRIKLSRTKVEGLERIQEVKLNVKDPA